MIKFMEQLLVNWVLLPAVTKQNQLSCGPLWKAYPTSNRGSSWKESKGLSSTFKSGSIYWFIVLFNTLSLFWYFL